jgi:hypothetical protein
MSRTLLLLACGYLNNAGVQITLPFLRLALLN